MIDIIRAHNRFNGLRFSAWEFGVVGTVALAIAAYFAATSSFIPAIVSFGIAANSVPVVVIAIAGLRSGESDIGFRAMREPAIRADARRQEPTLRRHMYILSGCSLIPFVVTVAVLVDAVSING